MIYNRSSLLCKIKGQHMNMSTLCTIKYMNWSYFSKARYMIGVGFKILARAPGGQNTLHSATGIVSILSNFDNTHMQNTTTFNGCKKGNFQLKKCDIFLFFFAENIDRGGSNEYQRPMF